MAFVVEDGTGLSDANSFVSVANADAYHSDRAGSEWTGDDVTKQSALIRASAVLTNNYSFQGQKVSGRSQSLSWPRSGVVDGDGYSIPSTELPREIIQATCELALRELVTPGSLTPDVTPADKVKREKIGDLEIEYASSSANVIASKPVVTIVVGLIGQFLAQSGSTTIAGEAYRA